MFKVLYITFPNNHYLLIISLCLYILQVCQVLQVNMLRSFSRKKSLNIAHFLGRPKAKGRLYALSILATDGCSYNGRSAKGRKNERRKDRGAGRGEKIQRKSLDGIINEECFSFSRGQPIYRASLARSRSRLACAKRAQLQHKRTRGG